MNANSPAQAHRLPFDLTQGREHFVDSRPEGLHIGPFSEESKIEIPKW